MIGNDSIDCTISELYTAWQLYKKGKNRSLEFARFSFNLENELQKLSHDLQHGLYEHKKYRTFEVCDNKRRIIQVALIRDKVVHRLVYEYLVDMYDKTFIYDVWSCRKGKGVQKCIQRTEYFAKKHKNGYFWRCDIKKFFESVDKQILYGLVCRKVKDIPLQILIKNIIESYNPSAPGMPIGNLTSQIFANIYLNELDRYMKHACKIKGYVRYGDDFLVFCTNKQEAERVRRKAILFIQHNLLLEINDKNDIIAKVRKGIKFLGVWVYPHSINLTKRNYKRVEKRLAYNNISSYSHMIRYVQDTSIQKQFSHQILTILDDDLIQ